MNEIYIRDPWRSLFGEVKAMMDDAFGSEFQNRGLKNLIRKPHNLLTKKDANGEVESFSLEVVYTPFKKDEVKVEILDNVLTVHCGTENREKNEDMVYCGISQQSYMFSLPLADTVDTTKITAKAEDGILYINLPVKKPEIKKVEPMQIAVL